VGEVNARALAKVFVSAADLEIAQSLQQWFTTPANQALLENLGKVGFSLAASEAELAAAARAEAEGSAALVGQTFVLTGTLPSLSRSQAQAP